MQGTKWVVECNVLTIFPIEDAKVSVVVSEQSVELPTYTQAHVRQTDFSPKRHPPHFAQGLCEEQKVFEFWAVRLFDFQAVQVTLRVEMEKCPAG